MLIRFFPGNQNKIQRVGVFVTLALILLVFFLHFPFAGYDFEYQSKCELKGPSSVEELNRMTAVQLDKVFADIRACEQSEELTKPFLDWKSNQPVIDWFASVVNFLATIALIFSLGFAWLWSFQSSNTRQK